MIILGPPLESREPTRLRSVMSKNLQEFAYRCVFRCVPSGRRGEIFPFPPTLAIFAPLLFPSFPYVYVCMCIYCSRVLSLLAFRSPAISRRRILNCSTVCDFLCGSSSCSSFSDGYPVLRKRVLSSARAARYSAFFTCH